MQENAEVGLFDIPESPNWPFRYSKHLLKQGYDSGPPLASALREEDFTTSLPNLDFRSNHVFPTTLGDFGKKEKIFKRT